MVAHIRLLISKSCLNLCQALITSSPNQSEIDLFCLASTVRIFFNLHNYLAFFTLHHYSTWWHGTLCTQVRRFLPILFGRKLTFIDCYNSACYLHYAAQENHLPPPTSVAASTAVYFLRCTDLERGAFMDVYLTLLFLCCLAIVAEHVVRSGMLPSIDALGFIN